MGSQFSGTLGAGDPGGGLLVCAIAAVSGFQLALCVRLGVPIPELDVSCGMACGACGMTHDKHGRHPSLCMRGKPAELACGYPVL